jgi:predicted NAD-dependent protein-ADP-ribosyltransferase YbiA (DUF1768 family)
MNTSRDKLMFFSKSADAKPGKGKGEVVSQPLAYTVLATIPNWRKVLSNFHVCPFRYKGRTYRTIEHAFHAVKISLESPTAARQFTVESGSNVGLGNGTAAFKKRKLVMLSPAKLAAWDAFSMYVMSDIARAKFAQCDKAARVLQATGNAQLWHYTSKRRSRGAAPIPNVRFTHLEDLRRELRETGRISKTAPLPPSMSAF